MLLWCRGDLRPSLVIGCPSLLHDRSFRNNLSPLDFWILSSPHRFTSNSPRSCKRLTAAAQTFGRVVSSALNSARPSRLRGTTWRLLLSLILPCRPRSSYRSCRKLSRYPRIARCRSPRRTSSNSFAVFQNRRRRRSTLWRLSLRLRSKKLRKLLLRQFKITWTTTTTTMC